MLASNCSLTPCRSAARSPAHALSALLILLTACSLGRGTAQAQQTDVLRHFGIHYSAPTSTRRDFGRPLPRFDSVSQLSLYLDTLKAEIEARKEARKRERARNSKGGYYVRTLQEKRAEKLEEKSTDYLEALRFYLKQRAYPNDRVNWKAYPEAIRHRDQMPAGRVRAQQAAPAPSDRTAAGHGIAAAEHSMWEYVGPRNVTTPYRRALGPGPVSGRTNAVAYTPLFLDPGQNTPGVYYAAGAGGGLWKSTDYGANWVPLSNDWPGQRVSCIAIDPTDSNVVYVGSGDAHGFVGYAFGIMKSTDGGTTWTNLGAEEFGGAPVSDILVDPYDPNIVVASTADVLGGRGRLWRSTDGGETWEMALDASTEQPVPSMAWTGMAMGAEYFGSGVEPRRIYYAVGCASPPAAGRVWGSSDRGATWTALPAPSNTTAILFTGADVAASPFTPDFFSPPVDFIYLLSGWDQQIFACSVPIFGTEPIFASAGWTEITGNYAGDFGQWFYNFFIAATESFKFLDAVYAGQIGLGLSPFGSNTWLDISLSYTGADLTHVDQHSMAISPFDPDESLTGNDGGVYRLLYDPFFQTWEYTSLNKTMGTIEFYRAAFHPFNPNKMIGGTQDNSTPGAFGDLNRWRIVGGGDGGFAAIHPTRPNVQFATSQFLTIYRTNNEWRSWGVTGPPTTSDLVYFIAPIAINPGDPKFLYAGTNFLYRYNSNTGQWSKRLGNVKLSHNDALSYIAVAPSDAQRIYTGSGVGEIYMTTNGGTTWQRIDGGITSLPSRFITGMAVHPSNPNRLIVTLSGTGAGHVWRCDNTTAGAARTWTNISGSGEAGLPDIPTNCVTLDIADPTNTYYVGTDVGVFMTADGGQTWSNITRPLGLPNVQVNDLHTVPGTGYLMAATFGRGMWRLKLAEPGVPVQSFTISPTITRGGFPISGIITLTTPAQAGGQVVTISNSDPDVVAAPTSITVPAGYRTLFFPMLTRPVATTKTVTLTASSGGTSKSATIRVVP